jgi:hypothetical protein
MPSKGLPLNAILLINSAICPRALIAYPKAATPGKTIPAAFSMAVASLLSFASHPICLNALQTLFTFPTL